MRPIYTADLVLMPAEESLAGALCDYFRRNREFLTDYMPAWTESFFTERTQLESIRGHMENAKKFVDYMLSETCQSYVGQNLTVRPLRQNAALNDSLTPWSDITRLESYDGVWVAENKAAITERYSECLENAE